MYFIDIKVVSYNPVKQTFKSFLPHHLMYTVDKKYVTYTFRLTFVYRCYEMLSKVSEGKDTRYMYSVCVPVTDILFFLINFFVFNSLGMLYVWRSNVLKFLGFFIDILRRWDHESYREGKFVYLFMLFCKVCLLRPE